MIEKLNLTALSLVVLFLFVTVILKDIELPHWFMAGTLGGLALSCAAAFILTLIKIWTYQNV